MKKTPSPPLEGEQLRVGYRVDKMVILAHRPERDEWTLRCDCGSRSHYKTKRLLRAFPTQCNKCEKHRCANDIFAQTQGAIEIRDYSMEEKAMIERFLSDKR